LRFNNFHEKDTDMKRFLFTVLGAIAGYIAGGLVGYLLVNLLSTNQHDRELEAAMTGAFFTGPLIAIIAAIIAFMLAGRKGTGRSKGDTAKRL
jgi:hypothetical protein